MVSFWEGFAALAEKIGVLGAMASFVILALGWALRQSSNMRIKEKQEQIDRLAEENHKYRELFMKRLDNAGNDNDEE